MPALPLDEAGKYVAAAYVVFLAIILVYVVIMAGRLRRLERELVELNEMAVARDAPEPGDGAPAEAELATAAGRERA